MTTTPLSYGAVINTSLAGKFKFDPSTTTGLTFGMTAGVFELANAVTTIAAGTVTLTDNTTNIVYVTSAGLQVSAVASQGIGVLYRVITSGGIITSITDLRGSLAAAT